MRTRAVSGDELKSIGFTDEVISMIGSRLVEIPDTVSGVEIIREKIDGDHGVYYEKPIYVNIGDYFYHKMIILESKWSKTEVPHDFVVFHYDEPSVIEGSRVSDWVKLMSPPDKIMKMVTNMEEVIIWIYTPSVELGRLWAWYGDGDHLKPWAPGSVLEVFDKIGEGITDFTWVRKISELIDKYVSTGKLEIDWDMKELFQWVSVVRSSEYLISKVLKQGTAKTLRESIVLAVEDQVKTKIQELKDEFGL